MFLNNSIEGTAERTEDWLVYFWEKIAGFGECIIDAEIELDDSTPDDPYWHVISSYRNAAKTELITRLNSWGFDLNSIEKHEVICSLLARQTTLAIEIASTPSIWNPNIAPMILRGMADVYVTVAWILLEPESRSKQFIDDALGSIKLEMEHRKQQINELHDPGERQELLDMIEIQKLWLGSQKLDQFIEVNLGSWSGLTTRKMAEEADCLSFYNYVFQPFSAAVHSNWYHASSLNTSFCQNPAHRYHKIATINEFSPDPFWLHLAAKYLNKTFRKFDEVTGMISTAPNAFEVLLKMLDQMPSDDETEIG